MTVIYGYFIKTINILDKQNGIREFYIESFSISNHLWKKKEKIRCIAETENHYPRTPLKLIGETKEDSIGFYFHAEECMETIPNQEIAIQFLSAPRFRGIGPASAKKLVSKAGYDLLHFVFEKDAFDVFKECCRCKDEKIYKFIAELKKPVLFYKTKEYMKEHKGTFEDAESVFKEYGEKSLYMMKHHPYLLINLGVSICTCDGMAVENKIHYLNEERIRVFVRDILRREDRNGDTYITFQNLCFSINDRYNTLGYIEPCHIAASCINDKTFCHIAHEKNEIRIYEKELYHAEKITAAKISRSVLTAKKYPKNKIDISKIEKSLKIKYAEKQKESFRLLEKSGIGLLIGEPGMGKTTLEKGFIRAFRQMFPEADIALCAPTAAAAKRMREATGQKAETIHRMLEVRPTGKNSYTSRDENSTLNYDFIIADECSMIDTRLFTMLIRALKPGSLLILVGDDGQLASVGSGNILRDLMQSGRIPTCKLNTYFRQDKNSTIAMNGKKIRTGDTELKDDETFRIIRVENGEEMQKKAMEYMRKYYNIKNPAQCRLFTTPRQKKFLNGTETLNRLIQKEFNGYKKEMMKRGDTVFLINDPVVFTKNNYSGSAVYLNGDEGRIMDIEHNPGKGDTLIVKTDTDILEIRGNDIKNIEPAYATTIYKAQGAECETAIILFPKEPVSLLDRSIALVAATRAKKKNIIITEGDALEQAIRTKRMYERNTGLQLRLRETFEDNGDLYAY